MVIRQFARIGEHTVSLIQRFHQQLRHESGLALAAFTRQQNHLSEEQPTDHAVKLRYSRTDAGQLIDVYSFHVGQLFNMGHWCHPGILHRFPDGLRSILPQNVVGVLFPR